MHLYIVYIFKSAWLAAKCRAACNSGRSMKPSARSWACTKTISEATLVTRSWAWELQFHPRSHNEICEALASLTAFEEDTGEAGETAAAEEEGIQDPRWPIAWCDLHLGRFRRSVKVRISKKRCDGMLQLCLREVGVTSGLPFQMAMQKILS